MKKLWNLVSFMAVVNIGALLIFGAWLWQSGRIDRQRLRDVRALFAPTIAEAEAEAAARAAEAENDAETDAEIRRRMAPPLPAEAQIEKVSLVSRQMSEGLQRMKDRTDQYLHELNLRAAQLDQREAALEAQQEVWERSLRAKQDERASAQFAQTVSLYETLAGKQAKRLLLELIDQEGGSLDRAATYLSSMSSRAAAKTLKELKTDVENELATRLLERIRTIGLEGPARAGRETAGGVPGAVRGAGTAEPSGDDDPRAASG